MSRRSRRSLPVTKQKRTRLHACKLLILFLFLPSFHSCSSVVVPTPPSLPSMHSPLAFTPLRTAPSVIPDFMLLVTLSKKLLCLSWPQLPHNTTFKLPSSSPQLLIRILRLVHCNFLQTTYLLSITRRSLFRHFPPPPNIARGQQ